MGVLFLALACRMILDTSLPVPQFSQLKNGDSDAASFVKGVEMREGEVLGTS